MRSPARKRHVPRILNYGTGVFVNWGPTAVDAVTGVRYPRARMMQQRGGLVHVEYGRGGRDRPTNY